MLQFGCGKRCDGVVEDGGRLGLEEERTVQVYLRAGPNDWRSPRALERCRVFCLDRGSSSRASGHRLVITGNWTEWFC